MKGYPVRKKKLGTLGSDVRIETIRVEDIREVLYIRRSIAGFVLDQGIVNVPPEQQSAAEQLRDALLQSDSPYKNSRTLQERPMSHMAVSILGVGGVIVLAPVFILIVLPAWLITRAAVALYERWFG